MADESNHNPTQTELEEFADLLGPVPASAAVLYLQAVLRVLLRLERHILSSDPAQSPAPASPPKRRGRPPKAR